MFFVAASTNKCTAWQRAEVALFEVDLEWRQVAEALAGSAVEKLGDLVEAGLRELGEGTSFRR